MRICRLVAGFPIARQTSIDGVAAPGPLSLTYAQLASGIEVHVICAGYPKLRGYKFEDGIHVYRVPQIRLELLGMKLISYGLSATLRLLHLDRRLHFDIVHGHAYDPAISFLCKDFMRREIGFLISVHLTRIGSFSKISPVDPVIMDLAESYPRILSILKSDIRSYRNLDLILERTTYRNADRLLANSESTARELEVYYGIPRERISVVYAGVNINQFHPNIDRQEIASRLALRESRVILCVAAFSLRKGLQYLIKAIPAVLEEVPNAMFIFVGKGFLRPLLQELVDRLGVSDSVRFLGTIQHEYLPSLYAVADLLVLPSVYEPFGKVLIEAMACGKPVIATKVSGIPEVVVDNETGILVPSKRPDLLARAIIRILFNMELAKKFAFRGRERVVSLFTWKKVAERVLETYKETVMEKNSIG